MPSWGYWQTLRKFILTSNFGLCLCLDFRSTFLGIPSLAFLWKAFWWLLSVTLYWLFLPLNFLYVLTGLRTGIHYPLKAETFCADGQLMAGWLARLAVPTQPLSLKYWEGCKHSVSALRAYRWGEGHGYASQPIASVYKVPSVGSLQTSPVQCGVQRSWLELHLGWWAGFG